MLFRKYLDLSRTYFELFSKVLRSFENTLVLIEHPLDCNRSHFWSSRAARELLLELQGCSRATFGAPGLLASSFWSSIAARELHLELPGCSRATFGAPGLLASYFWSSRVVLSDYFEKD
ncbi:hypothetical protein ZOSMA_13436G00010, partial [Zostera marina]